MVKWLEEITVAPEESQNFYHFHDNRVLPSHVTAVIAKEEGYAPSRPRTPCACQSRREERCQDDRATCPTPGLPFLHHCSIRTEHLPVLSRMGRRWLLAQRPSLARSRPCAERAAADVPAPPCGLLHA